MIDSSLIAAGAAFVGALAGLIGAAAFAIREVVKSKNEPTSQTSMDEVHNNISTTLAQLAHEDVGKLIEGIHRLELAIERQTSAIERQATATAETLAWARDTHEDVQKVHDDVKLLKFPMSNKL